GLASRHNGRLGRERRRRKPCQSWKGGAGAGARRSQGQWAGECERGRQPNRLLIRREGRMLLRWRCRDEAASKGRGALAPLFFFFYSFPPLAKGLWRVINYDLQPTTRRRGYCYACSIADHTVQGAISVPLLLAAGHPARGRLLFQAPVGSWTARPGWLLLRARFGAGRCIVRQDYHTACRRSAKPSTYILISGSACFDATLEEERPTDRFGRGHWRSAALACGMFCCLILLRG
ncbi:hypothetical protein B0J12DRAFT_748068, partial [Macrophomina phaseolina]